MRKTIYLDNKTYTINANCKHCFGMGVIKVQGWTRKGVWKQNELCKCLCAKEVKNGTTERKDNSNKVS